MQPTDTANRIWSISGVNRMVRELLEQSLYPFWVTGEVANLTLHRSGHAYFTLRDERAQLSGVFFRGVPACRQAGLHDGMRVEAHGRLSVYEPRGQYQLVIDRLRPAGIGDLQRLFEEIKERLRSEGLFDSERKRPIPMLPGCVGVVTSPQGAAIRDFLNVTERRFGTVHVRIYPAAVQGESAAAQVAEGVRFFNRTRSCDVIVLTRGGGSLEDLWPFNDEQLARAVAASEIPVVSAVGHEVDYTICDFVADLRVPTPSAAGELVVSQKAELLERVARSRARLADRLRLRLAEAEHRLQRAAHHPVFQRPQGLVRLYQQRIDEMSLRLARAMYGGAETLSHRLERARASLAALSPFAVLTRGYAVLTQAETGQVVSAAADTAPGDALQACLAHGSLDLAVTAAHQGPARPTVEEPL